MRAGSYLDALRAAPLTTGIELTAGRPFIVLSPHPDDETLGTGGLIADACARGQRVDILVITDGSGSHPRSRQYPRQRLVELRRGEVQKAGLALGLQPGHLEFLGLTDTRAPKSGPLFDAAVDRTLAMMERSGARTLFVTWQHDPHCDHEATAALARAVRSRGPGVTIWAYPIWGWHLPVDAEIDQPGPGGFRIDISKYRARKLAAIEAHASQMTDLISDDPGGFRFDAGSLAPFLGPFEHFIEVPL